MSSFEWDGKNEPEVFVDFLGHEIRPGDYIIYSTVSGSSPILTLGKLEAFVVRDKAGKEYRGYSYREEAPYYYKMYVQPLLGRGWGRGLDAKSLPRKVYLGSSATVVKADVTHASLPEES